MTANNRLKVILSHVPKIQTHVLGGDSQEAWKNVSVAPAPAGIDPVITTSLFTPGCLEFLVELVERFDCQADEVLRKRIAKRCIIEGGGLMPEFQEEASDWQIDTIPVRLQNRKLDLGDISPCRTELLIDSMKSSVQGIQVDFDDGHCPSWRNQLQGLFNIYLAVRNQLAGAPSIKNSPIFMLRPRAWNMIEHNVMIKGRQVLGPLFDFGILAYHNGSLMSECGCGPYFYLSKVESASEARLWNDVFTWSEQRLGLVFGTIKSCVLIENVLATYEMEAILYELRHHCIGLNCGIWDYSASIISLFGRRPDFVISDRTRYVNIDQAFLKSYMELLVHVCHKHGALATGGMAALLLSSDEGVESVVRRVCDGKLKEIRMGLDGFMVHDIGLVPYMHQLWKDNCPQDNQLGLPRLPIDLRAHGGDLLRVPVGQVSLSALQHNIAVATLFIDAWLRGCGTFTFRGAVEDSATAEISRWQVWQWIYHEVVLQESAGVVNSATVFRLLDAFTNEHVTDNRKRLIMAGSVMKQLVTARSPPLFITTYLSEHPAFRSRP